MSDVEHHLVQLFKRRLYLIALEEKHGPNAWRQQELAATEWALEQLTALFEDEAAAAERIAQRMIAARAEQGAYR